MSPTEWSLGAGRILKIDGKPVAVLTRFPREGDATRGYELSPAKADDLARRIARLLTYGDDALVVLRDHFVDAWERGETWVADENREYDDYAEMRRVLEGTGHTLPEREP